ncbi:MAG: cobalamin-dependent protein [Caldilineaceae bacterium]
MRIALINPRFRLPIDTRTTPHLGLAYLAAVSEKRGDEVVIFDADVERQSIAEFVQEYRPDLVGITANTPQVKQAWRTAKAIKEVHDCPIVLGGPHVSVLPEESCEKPYVDIVVRGEGEDAWIEISNLLEEFLKDQPVYSTEAFMHPENEVFKNCLGVTYKTSDGQIHNNPDRDTHRRPRQPALAYLPSVQDGALHQFAARHRQCGRLAQLQHPHQPWLPLPLHLLLAEHHAHQVAQPQRRKRPGRVEAPGGRHGRAGNRRS